MRGRWRILVRIRTAMRWIQRYRPALRSPLAGRIFQICPKPVDSFRNRCGTPIAIVLFATSDSSLAWAMVAAATHTHRRVSHALAVSPNLHFACCIKESKQQQWHFIQYTDMNDNEEHSCVKWYLPFQTLSILARTDVLIVNQNRTMRWSFFDVTQSGIVQENIDDILLVGIAAWGCRAHARRRDRRRWWWHASASATPCTFHWPIVHLRWLKWHEQTPNIEFCILHSF